VGFEWRGRGFWSVIRERHHAGILQHLSAVPELEAAWTGLAYSFTELRARRGDLRRWSEVGVVLLRDHLRRICGGIMTAPTSPSAFCSSMTRHLRSDVRRAGGWVATRSTGRDALSESHDRRRRDPADLRLPTWRHRRPEDAPRAQVPAGVMFTGHGPSTPPSGDPARG
jgi:hypothetical protein